VGSKNTTWRACCTRCGLCRAADQGSLREDKLRFRTLVTAAAQVIRTLRKDEKPVVIDADGLHILKHNLDLLKVC
jgi:hypothetical protein